MKVAVDCRKSFASVSSQFEELFVFARPWMRKRTWRLAVVVLLTCAVFVTKTVDRIMCVAAHWDSRGLSTANSTFPGQFTYDEAAVDDEAGIFEHDPKIDVDRASIPRVRFTNPCAGSLYPTPAEGKLARAKVSRTEFSLFIYDHNSVKDIVSHSIRTSGSWELQETQKLMGLMPCAPTECHNRVFVDIGANLGWYSLAAVNMGFSVLSFEPFQSNLGLICSSARNLDRNIADRIKVFNVGLDFKPRHCELFQQKTVNVGDTHSVCDGASRTRFIEKGYSSLGWMNTTTLDIALEAGLFNYVDHIDVMKVDVEGFEYSVMEGGNRFFLSSLAPKYIFMELVSSMMGDAGGLSDRGESRLESVLMKLTNYGYELDHVSNSAGNGVSLRTSPIREVRRYVDGKNVLFKRVMDQ